LREGNGEEKIDQEREHDRERERERERKREREREREREAEREREREPQRVNLKRGGAVRVDIKPVFPSPPIEVYENVHTVFIKQLCCLRC